MASKKETRFYAVARHDFEVEPEKLGTIVKVYETEVEVTDKTVTRVGRGVGMPGRTRWPVETCPLSKTREEAIERLIRDLKHEAGCAERTLGDARNALAEIAAGRVR